MFINFNYDSLIYWSEEIQSYWNVSNEHEHKLMWAYQSPLTFDTNLLFFLYSKLAFKRVRSDLIQLFRMVLSDNVVFSQRILYQGTVARAGCVDNN